MIDTAPSSQAETGTIHAVGALPPVVQRAPGPAQPLWPILAGTRFVLAMIVVASHWSLVAPRTDPFFAVGSRFGGIAAVLGFLAISGFSIAHSYAQEPRRFFVRRAARILPVYLVVLVAWWALFQVLGADALVTATGEPVPGPTTWQTVQNALLLQGITTIAAFGPGWSLGIECWFYMAAPILMAARPAVVRGLAFVSMAAYLFIVPLGLTGLSVLRFGLGALVIGWPWLLGLLLRRGGRTRFDAAVLALSGTVLLYRFTGGDSPLSIATWLLTSAALRFGHRARPGPVLTRVLNELGEISYPLYLCHVPVIAVCSALLHLRSTPAMLAITLLVATALAHAVDLPARARLRRLRLGADPARLSRWLLATLALCCAAALP